MLVSVRAIVVTHQAYGLKFMVAGAVWRGAGYQELLGNAWDTQAERERWISVISTSLCKLGGNVGFERWRSVVGLAPAKPNLSWTGVGRVVA